MKLLSIEFEAYKSFLEKQILELRPITIVIGISNPEAIKSMVMLSRNTVESGLIEKIKKAFL